MAKHNSLSDSTTEAEYKELAKTAKCFKFVLMLQKKLKLADLPGILFEDNTGAIFLSQKSHSQLGLNVRKNFRRALFWLFQNI